MRGLLPSRLAIAKLWATVRCLRATVAVSPHLASGTAMKPHLPVWLVICLALAACDPQPPTLASEDAGLSSQADVGAAQTPDSQQEPDVAAEPEDVTDTAIADAAGQLPVGCKVTAKLSVIENEYFGGSCAFSSCHSSKKKAGGLVLEVGKSHASLVNVLALQTKAANAGRKRVVPGNPDASYLVQRVAKPMAGEGALMPPGEKVPYDPDCGIAALRAWIVAGAANN